MANSELELSAGPAFRPRLFPLEGVGVGAGGEVGVALVSDMVVMVQVHWESKEAKNNKTRKI